MKILLEVDKPFAPGSPLRPGGPDGPTGPFGPGKPIVEKICNVHQSFLSKDDQVPGTPAAPLAPGAPIKY